MSAAERGSRLPDPFHVTPEMRAWAREHAPHVELRKVTEEFVDFWRGVPGAKGRKVDWAGTWRNRMRECEARVQLNGGAREPHEPEPMTKFDRLQKGLGNG